MVASRTSDRPSASTFPAPITRHRSPARRVRSRNRSASSKPGSQATRRGGGVGRRRRHQPPVDAREILRPLARWIHLEDDDDVGGSQSGAELPRERLGARVQVWLKDGDQAGGAERARRRDRRRDLRRVVGVVVVDGNAGAGLAEQLEPSPGAVEVRQHAGRAPGIGSGEHRGGQRARGVDRVVGAGHRQRDLDVSAIETASRLRTRPGRARHRGPRRAGTARAARGGPTRP